MCQSEIKNVFDLLHVSGYFSHGNGFTPVWLVGTEKKPLFLMPLKTVLVFYPDILKKRKTRLKKKHLED